MEITTLNKTTMTEAESMSEIAKYRLNYTFTNGRLTVLSAQIYPVADGVAEAQMHGRIMYNNGIIESSGMTSIEVLPDYFSEFNTILSGLKAGEETQSDEPC